MPNSHTVAGMMSGYSLIMAHLVRQLDARGLLSKDEFADQIENAIIGQPMKEADGRVRYDRLMIENVVKLLRSPQSGWSPQLIQGGLSSEPDDDSSGP